MNAATGHNDPTTPVGAPNLVVMGVSGCGKSLIGTQLAAALGFESLEGDAFHSAENIARMSAGVPLTDENRAGWLANLSERLAQARAQGRHIVLSCSALKRRYRDVLRQGDPQLVFVYLHGERAVIEARMASRTHHFMPVTLLDSQFHDLEVPQADEDALTVNIEHSPEEIVSQVVTALRARA